MAQVTGHGESTRLQYGLSGARESSAGIRPGSWSSMRTWATRRPGPRPGRGSAAVSEVGLDHVGIVLGTEMSRLARPGGSGILLELCALSGTLLGDPEGVYDPAAHNDRLLLGLKGTISEAELHLIRQRMLGGRIAKARRGSSRSRCRPDSPAVRPARSSWILMSRSAP